MKTNRFLLAACVSLAMVFTLSCSDDKNSGGGAVVSCTNDDWNNFKICMEVPASYEFENEEGTGTETFEPECRYGRQGVFSNTACSSGWLKKCDDIDGMPFTYYIYTENITCSDYWGD